MKRKVVYLGKTSRYFTHNKEYEVNKIELNGDIIIDDDHTIEMHRISPDYFRAEFRNVTLNEEIQKAHEERAEYRFDMLVERLKELEKINFWLSILVLIQFSVIAWLSIKIVLS